MRCVPIFAALASLAACSEPHSEAYYETHPDVAAATTEKCRTGAHRGEECDQALAGAAAAARKARMALYRKAF